MRVLVDAPCHFKNSSYHLDAFMPHVAVACGKLPVIKMLRAAAAAGEEARAGRRAARGAAEAREMERRAELQKEWLEGGVLLLISSAA